MDGLIQSDKLSISVLHSVQQSFAVLAFTSRASSILFNCVDSSISTSISTGSQLAQFSSKQLSTAFASDSHPWASTSTAFRISAKQNITREKAFIAIFSSSIEKCIIHITNNAPVIQRNRFCYDISVSVSAQRHNCFFFCYGQSCHTFHKLALKFHAYDSAISERIAASTFNCKR